MKQPPRGFEQAEYEARTEKLQRVMHDKNIDAVLFTNEAEVRYYTGFHTQFWQSPTRPWFLVVPANGKPIAVIPAIGEAGMRETWIDEIHIWSSPQPEDDGVGLLSNVIAGLSRKHKTLGVQLGPETALRMPAADFEKLKHVLHGVEIVDVAQIIYLQRLVKSEAEIEKIRFAAVTTSLAFERLPEYARMGQTEREICTAMKIDLMNHGVDGSPYMVAGSGRGSYNNIIMGPLDRKLGDGDVLIIDTGTTYDGYFCDFDRNWAFGHASDEAMCAYEAVFAATDAGFTAAIPGATMEDVWHAMQKVLDEAGALSNSTGRMGHGLGMQLTEWPSLMPGDKTVIKPNTVLTLEPGMEFAPNQMMVHEENIVIREAGAEYLSLRAAERMPIIS